MAVDAPRYDPNADFTERAELDPERLEATRNDDRAWFDAHPARLFHVRPVTPHERACGADAPIMLVCRKPGGRIRLGGPFSLLLRELMNLEALDTDERAGELFDQATADKTRENTDKREWLAIEWIKRRRAQLTITAEPRFMSQCMADEEFFQRNPSRVFRVRKLTSLERKLAGGKRALMLIGNAGNRNLLKMPFATRRPLSAEFMDGDKAGAILFDWLTRNAAPENTDALTFRMFDEVRRRRGAVPARAAS